MNRKTTSSHLRTVLFGFGLLALSAVGCQSNIAGQTLPSAYYLRDDIQYFIPGPETPLFNQRRAIEEYRAGQEGAGAAPAPVPGGGAAPGGAPGGGAPPMP